MATSSRQEGIFISETNIFNKNLLYKKIFLEAKDNSFKNLDYNSKANLRTCLLRELEDLKIKKKTVKL